MACPKCGADESWIVFQGEDRLYNVPGVYSVSECRQCGLWFQNPRPPADRLPSLYPPYYGPHATAAVNGSPTGNAWAGRLFRPLRSLAAMVRAFRLDNNVGYLIRRLGYAHLGEQSTRPATPKGSQIFDWWRKRQSCIDLIPRFVDQGTLLEIGCSTGERLRSLRALGWNNVFGIELVPAAAEIAASRGMAVTCGAVETLLDRFPKHFFDVIISSMVLEHLLDPFTVVRQIARKLKPGGEFLLSTVVRDSLDAKMYGAYWSGFDFPRHMVHFRKRDIWCMLGPHFRVLEVHHQNAPIDFVRPCVWRRKPLDNVVRLTAESGAGDILGFLLALLGLTSRVSFRCLGNGGP